jgi:integrase
MAKRGNGEGTICKRKDGRWEAKSTVGYNEAGKPVRKSTYHKTRKAAQDALREAQTRMANNFAQLDQSTTLRQWADVWLESKKGAIAASTYENYVCMSKHFLPVLGRFKLRDLKKVQLQTFLNELGRTKSGNVLGKVRSLLYCMLQEAEDNEMVLRNVARGLKLSKSVEPVQKRGAFTSAEVAVIEANAGEIDFLDVAAILLNTGLREGELLALRRQNVDVENFCVHVTNSATRVNGKPVLGPTKTPESVRTIPVPKRILGLILARLPDDGGFMFRCRNGDIWSPRSFLKYYKRALETAQLRYLSPHCCRHTYATRLHAAGADAKTIQTLMGHTDYALTANLYTHVRYEELQKAVGLLDETA